MHLDLRHLNPAPSFGWERAADICPVSFNFASSGADACGESLGGKVGTTVGYQVAAPVTTWDAALLDVDRPASLVTIARDRRLVLEDSQGPRWVDLCWVDEVALTLIDLSISRGHTLDLVYPAPAGQVAVLLAAQLLLHQFVRRVPSPSVGIVTADPTGAAKTWDALRIATTGGRERISQVFPCFRAGPDGDSPWGGRRLQGVIIGQSYRGWPVDHVIVDHLAGFVDARAADASIEVFADPLDPGLRRAHEQGRLVWGWSDTDLGLWGALEERREHTVPFSVASDRLQTMAGGVDVTLVVCRHREAEDAVARIREDLRLLRSLAPHRTDRNMERGLSVAWHHLSTLISLPCAPSQFDRFAGLPPMAARSTRTFERELEAWAQTLTGDAQEIATILASDIGDLRACLDEANPFAKVLAELRNAGEETLVITRTNTASKALLDMLGVEPDARRVGALSVCAVGRLHRQGTWPRAVMIGEPPPWDWHRLLSGLAPQLQVLALGEKSALACATAVSEVQAARDHWAGVATRTQTWRALVGTDPPPPPAPANRPPSTTMRMEGHEYVPEPDPFESLAGLFDLDPLDVGGEGPRAALAREQETGDWTADTRAVEVTTTCGKILLEADRPVEVRVGPKIVDKRPESLESGDVLLVGRHQGRVGLIEALEERLGHRPDLLAARLLLDGYRKHVRQRFAASGLTVVALHRAMVELGCEKSSAAVRDWVTAGTMAPQHFDDLERLNTALQLGMSDVQLAEFFAGVQRRRGFRRAAGRALAAAARDAVVVEDQGRIDPETGLSVADLRDAVVQAEVISVQPCDSPVPFTLLGHLEPS